MKRDYLIVGCGLAGICFAEILLQKHHSFTIVDNLSQTSTRIAAGLYNPVILKRFTEAWNASEQLTMSLPFYTQIEKRLQQHFDYPVSILRKFYSVEEQNNWFVAADQVALQPFLSSAIIHKNYPGLPAPFGFGEVFHTGYVATDKLLESYQKFLIGRQHLQHHSFDYTQLQFVGDEVFYEGTYYSRVVFAEGYGLKQNPFFEYLPLDGTKGEILIIQAAGLEIDCIVNGSVFILPLGNQLFKVGATYNWKDKSNLPTPSGLEELQAKLEEMITVPYKVVSHLAGVRPTVNDRKPLLGKHPQFKSLAVLNGMGTRGVLLAPVMALQLYNHLENSLPLDPLVAISRYNQYFKTKAEPNP